MQFNVSFDSATRLMTYEGEIQTAEEDAFFLYFTFNDSQGLLDGFSPYCVYEDGTKVPIQGTIEIPDSLIKQYCGRLIVQLRFDKEEERFYSLNTLRINLNKILCG